MLCRLCGAASTPRLVAKKAYGDCPRCGYLGLEESRFIDSRAERMRYLLHENDGGDPGYRSYLESFIAAAIIPTLKPRSSVLDFGSGPTPVLSGLLGAEGFETGIYDPFFAPDDRWESREWDAIVLHEVAEHLHCPESVFTRIAERIRPGGILAIRTRFVPETTVGLDSWWYLSDSTHVGFFRERSFDFLAEKLGFGLLLRLRPDIAVLRRSEQV